MDQYIKADLELHALLGCDAIYEPAGGGLWHKNDCRFTTPLTEFSRDQGACFALAMEHNIAIGHCENWGIYTFVHGAEYEGVHHDIANHPSKLTCGMFAVVQAVIEKLKNEK